MPRRGHGADAENRPHWVETARAGDSLSDTAERELPRMDRSTTLTAHLARAAGTRAVELAQQICKYSSELSGARAPHDVQRVALNLTRVAHNDTTVLRHASALFR